MQFNGQNLTNVYESGCRDYVSRHNAVKRLGGNAKLEFNGPTNIGRDGGICTKSKHGIYTIKLSLLNGTDAVISGVSLKQITSEFLIFPLHQMTTSMIYKRY